MSPSILGTSPGATASSVVISGLEKRIGTLTFHADPAYLVAAGRGGFTAMANEIFCEAVTHAAKDIKAKTDPFTYF